MNPNQTDAYKYLGQAQQARKAGDRRLARQYAEQAARLAPELEDVWLMMAALASPRASVVFMEKALQINPESERVRQGMHWAVERLRQEPPPAPIPPAPPAPVPPAPPAPPAPVTTPKTRNWPHIFWMAILLLMMCLVIWAAAVWAGPLLAAAVVKNSTGNQNHPAGATAQLTKATHASAASATLEPALTLSSSLATATHSVSPTTQEQFTATDLPVATATQFDMAPATATPAPFPTDALTPTPLDTDLVAYPTPTALPTDTALPPAGAAPQATRYVAPPAAPNTTSAGRWVDVDLTHQMVYAYEGNTVVNSFLVSTGTWQHPTVTGQYHVYVKYRYANMTGPGYSLPNVPYTMYFYKGYALHGTYWHSNFGTPMSHGCVNLSIPEAGWLFNWASVGTLVNVHY